MRIPTMTAIAVAGILGAAGPIPTPAMAHGIYLYVGPRPAPHYYTDRDEGYPRYWRPRYGYYYGWHRRHRYWHRRHHHHRDWDDDERDWSRDHR